MSWERVIKASLLSGGFMYGLAQYLHGKEQVGTSKGKIETAVGSPTRLLEYPHFKILYSNVPSLSFSTTRALLLFTSC